MSLSSPYFPHKVLVNRFGHKKPGLPPEVAAVFGNRAPVVFQLEAENERRQVGVVRARLNVPTRVVGIFWVVQIAVINTQIRFFFSSTSIVILKQVSLYNS